MGTKVGFGQSRVWKLPTSGKGRNPNKANVCIFEGRDLNVTFLTGGTDLKIRKKQKKHDLDILSCVGIGWFATSMF
eukprot:5543710-Amphidinium_carterae.1